MLTNAASAPSVPTPLEALAAAIDQVGPLHGLPLEDRLWLARHGQEFVAQAGDILFEEGAPADNMMILFRGEIHVRRQHGGPMALFIGRTAQLTGVLPFSRMKSYGGQGRAVAPVWALLIPRTLFPEMLQAIPSMAQRVVSTLLDRAREVTRIEQQAEKLAALGKLAGNLAHELNNPASAAQRAASTLVTALHENRANRFKLVNLCLSEEQIGAVEAWEAEILSRRPAAEQLQTSDPNELLAREDSIRNWLDKLGCPDAPAIAAPLAEHGAAVADLDRFRTILGAHEASISLQFFARFLRSARSAEALVHSTARIFDLIDAVKDYSNMDRALILEVDVPAGLDATLQMFGSRMDAIQVEREYEPDLPRISAYGGELNQVWTAMIENALDAMNDKGVLRLACRCEGEMLLVEIWDCGPGISPELRERIFEPFFTTKAPGAGLGLGLDQAMRIVRKHRGHIGVDSRPGSTCFRVRLPLNQFQAY
ncbi:MAG: sensor histidine kinase [Acidobacteriota bacterium]